MMLRHRRRRWRRNVPALLLARWDLVALVARRRFWAKALLVATVVLLWAFVACDSSFGSLVGLSYLYSACDLLSLSNAPLLALVTFWLRDRLALLLAAKVPGLALIAGLVDRLAILLASEVPWLALVARLWLWFRACVALLLALLQARLAVWLALVAALLIGWAVMVVWMVVLPHLLRMSWGCRWRLGESVAFLHTPIIC